MRRASAVAVRRDPGQDAVDAVLALTVDDLDDDEVARVGILRAVFDLVRRTVAEHGGIPGKWGPQHAECASQTRRLAREALDVWDVLDEHSSE